MIRPTTYRDVEQALTHWKDKEAIAEARGDALQTAEDAVDEMHSIQSQCLHMCNANGEQLMQVRNAFRGPLRHLEAEIAKQTVLHGRALEDAVVAREKYEQTEECHRRAVREGKTAA